MGPHELYKKTGKSLSHLKALGHAGHLASDVREGSSHVLQKTMSLATVLGVLERIENDSFSESLRTRVIVFREKIGLLRIEADNLDSEIQEHIQAQLKIYI